VITLWLGNVLDPTDLLSLIPILRSIRDELDERHDLIGNWLYCLRDRVLVPSTTRIKQKAGAGPSLGKRERGANEGGAESKGDRKDSATANERTGAGGGHRLMVNLDRTSSVRTWVRAVSSSGSW